MLLNPINYEKQELRSDKNSTICSLAPAENRRYCQWQKERTKKLLDSKKEWNYNTAHKKKINTSKPMKWR
jgi:hypothetical protein